MDYERLHRRKKKISYSWSLGTRFLPGEVPIGAFDHCFNCGKSGHWKESCTKHRRNSFKNDHCQKRYGVSNDRTVTNKRQHKVNWHHAWRQEIFSIFESLGRKSDELKDAQNLAEPNAPAGECKDLHHSNASILNEEKELENTQTKLILRKVRKIYSASLTDCTYQEFLSKRLEATKIILHGNSC